MSEQAQEREQAIAEEDSTDDGRSQGTDIERADLFSTTPMERHGDTPEGHEAAGIEANQLLGVYIAKREIFSADLAVWRRKLARIDAAIETLQATREDYRKTVEAGEVVVERRCSQWFGQVVMYIDHYLRRLMKRPPSQHEFPAGIVRYKKQRTKVEKCTDEEALAALDRAQLPFWVMKDAVCAKREPNWQWLGKHLGEDGHTLTAPDTDGVVHEFRLAVVDQESAGGITRESPLRRTVPPPVEYIVTAERPKEAEGDGKHTD